MSVLVASDLDRTLIYSAGAIEAYGTGAAELVPVERYGGSDASWMTAAAARRFARLHRSAQVVAVTTRTPQQYRRVRLPGPAPGHAIVANGGVLLVNDEADRDWTRHMAARLGCVASLAEVWEHVARVCRPEWTVKLRNADGLFCYAVLHRDSVPPGFLAEVGAWARTRGWQVSLQGRKLYWVPATLTKSAAVEEVARRVGAGVVVAAGDSLLDADLLEQATRGIVARHGELVASGWHADHVTTTATSGVLAGEEIVEWFTAGLPAG